MASQRKIDQERYDAAKASPEGIAIRIAYRNAIQAAKAAEKLEEATGSRAKAWADYEKAEGVALMDMHRALHKLAGLPFQE